MIVVTVGAPGLHHQQTVETLDDLEILDVVIASVRRRVVGHATARGVALLVAWLTEGACPHCHKGRDSDCRGNAFDCPFCEGTGRRDR